MKVLFFDIEMAPMEVFAWGPRQDYIGHYMVKSPPFIVAWGAKWRDSDKIYQGVVTSTEAVNKDDERIVSALADLVREADVVIGHNVDRHDLSILRGRLAIHQLEPIPPMRTIDTLKLAKRDLGLDYNGMEPLSLMAGIPIEKKIGMENWKRCLAGDRKALKLLREYNHADVVGTEQLFDWMLPYVQRIARLVDGPGHVCPTCTNSKLQKRGKARSNVSTWQRWHCQNCKRYSRTKVLAELRHPLHPL